MKRFFRFLAPAALAAFPFVASAQIKLLPPCTATGDCGVTDILAVLVNGAEYLLGITGAVALLFFVYGGFKFVLAAGDKAKVSEAIGILRSAVIGIAIIFLSGILVRFTTRALTGGSSAIPTVGENCNVAAEQSLPKTCTSSKDCNNLGSCSNGVCTAANGLWVSIPPGLDAQGKLIPEGLKCIPTKDGCTALNNELKKRNRLESYSCKSIQDATSCVRGLCTGSGQGADIACCL